MSSERWNTVDEFVDELVRFDDDLSLAGVTIAVDDDGQRLVYPGETPICVIGSTGTGKTQCIVLPFVADNLQKGVSQIVFDTKGEILANVREFIPDNVKVIVFNLRNPTESTHFWNPLLFIYKLFVSVKSSDNELARLMIASLCYSAFPPEGNDPFWQDTARQLLEALILALFEAAEDEALVHFESIIKMLEQATKKDGVTLAVKEMQRFIKDNICRMLLSIFADAPNDTRSSIFSVELRGLMKLIQSLGIMDMLCEDTLDLEHFDLEQPFCMFFVTPDETDVYDPIAGIMISIFTQFLIREAYERGGKLPRRVCLVLEELGSIGGSIPTLKNLMAAGRSRGIVPLIVLQSYSQLDDIYGKSNAQTIRDNIGTTIGFSTNSMETLREWSAFCGEKEKKRGGYLVSKPLITPGDLAAMPAGRALIILHRQYKFVSQLPFFNELYKPKGNNRPLEPALAPSGGRRVFDMCEWNKQKRREKIETASRTEDDHYLRNMMLLHSVEDEEKPEKNNMQGLVPVYKVIITDDGGKKDELIKLLMTRFKLDSSAAEKRLEHLPCSISFETAAKAGEFIWAVADAGGTARVESCLTERNTEQPDTGA